MESSALRRKDTTKGPPLRILSLDGGGVRGYSMLILLQELMYKTYNEVEGVPPMRDQIPKPCDYFDLIVGTGTGGLIAIMLGRLRMDLETCKDVWVRLTKRVFETDKTIAGIPYRSTLFKASKLEEAIKECVREHTIYDDEGNDGPPTGARERPLSPGAASVLSDGDRPLSMASSVRSGAGGPNSFDLASPRNPPSRWGNPNAYLYDARTNRTKTAVTALFKGTAMGGDATLLRSYDSRKETAPEFNCTIWQAARATSAVGLAFKPIQIGQSVFIDEGAGRYNPSPQALDEALINEWPGRELGVMVSIGTGKRPPGTQHLQHEWWEGFVGGGLGDFAEARRRLISKIEGCEETHQYMLREGLARRGVAPEHYFRLNVEVGVGEFGMNEWSRLADISTNTRRYLAKPDTRRINEDASTKLARIERATRRWQQQHQQQPSPSSPLTAGEGRLAMDPLAVELPGDEGRNFSNPHRNSGGPRYSLGPSNEDKFTVMPPESSASASASSPNLGRTRTDPTTHVTNGGRPSGEYPRTRRSEDVARPAMPMGSPMDAGYHGPPISTHSYPPPRPPKTPHPPSSNTMSTTSRPTPVAASVISSGANPTASIISPASSIVSSLTSPVSALTAPAPGLPQMPPHVTHVPHSHAALSAVHPVHPVLPSHHHQAHHGPPSPSSFSPAGQPPSHVAHDVARYHAAPYTAPTTVARLPYPDDDGPPPVVNMAGKPQLVQRRP